MKLKLVPKDTSCVVFRNHEMINTALRGVSFLSTIIRLFLGMLTGKGKGNVIQTHEVI